MNKVYEIEGVLRDIKFNAEYAINSIDHVRYGDNSAKQRVVQMVNSIENKMSSIQAALDGFLFEDK